MSNDYDSAGSRVDHKCIIVLEPGWDGLFQLNPDSKGHDDIPYQRHDTGHGKWNANVCDLQKAG